MGHPQRIRVLELLTEGEQSVSALLEQVDVEQSALSQQPGILRRAVEILVVSRQMLLDMVSATHDELRHA